MILRSMFLKAFFVVIVAPAVFLISCENTTEPNTTTDVKPTGTLYYNYSTISTNEVINALDLSTGKITQTVKGLFPYRTKEGTTICMNEKGLVEYSQNNGSVREIVEWLTNDGLEVRYNNYFGNPQVSPDGKYIAYEGNDFNDEFYIVDRYTGELLHSYYPGSGAFGYSRPVWTNDNRIIVAGNGPNSGLYISSADWKTLEPIGAGLSMPIQPAVSPDGKTVAFIMDENLWTIGIDGTNLKQVTTSAWKESWPEWSPNGKWIGIYGDNSILLLPMTETGAVDAVKINKDFSIISNRQFSWR